MVVGVLSQFMIDRYSVQEGIQVESYSGKFLFVSLVVGFVVVVPLVSCSERMCIKLCYESEVSQWPTEGEEGEVSGDVEDSGEGVEDLEPVHSGPGSVEGSDHDV